MKHVWRILIGWVLLVCITQAQAADGERARWEFGARVGGMITDNALRLDGSAEVLTLTRSLGDKRALELELGADQLDFSIDYGLRHTTLALNYLEVNREPLWDPYLLVGIGVSEFDAPSGITEGRDAMMQVGTGGSWELSDNGKLLLRGDVRFRYDLNGTGQPGQDGWGDAIFTVGLSYRF
jgi:hypothetical protein